MNWGIFMGWLSAIPNYGDNDIRIMSIMFFGGVLYVVSCLRVAFVLHCI